MIDKLPIISAKSEAFKASEQPNDSSENDTTASFESVLAKQVAKEDTEKAPTSQSVDEAAEDVSVAPKTDDELPVDAALTEPSAEVKAGFVDAQALALKATNDGLDAATDGEVSLVQTAASDNHTEILTTVAALTPAANTQSNTASTAPETSNQTANAGHADAVSRNHSQAADADVLQNQVTATDKQALNVMQQASSAYQAKQDLAMQELAQSGQIEGVSTVTQSMTHLSSLQQSQAVTQVPGSSNIIQAYPGKTGWNEAISQKIVWMVGAAEQSATLTLNPKDLGPLQVVIQVNNEKADATFISENPEVRKALEEGMSQLRQSMSQTGIELGQANVNSNKQHQAFQQANHGRFGQQVTAEDSQSLGELPVASQQVRVSNGLVDTFA